MTLDDRMLLRSYHVASILFVLVFLVSVFRVVQTGFVIDTNIKNLAPELNRNAQISSGLESLSKLAENTFVIALAHPDEDVLFDASEMLGNYTEEQLSYISLSRQGEAFDRLIDLYKQHRFHLLSPSAQVKISGATDKEILQSVKSNFFASNNLIRLVSLKDDPSGYLNDYLLDVFSRMAIAQDDIVPFTVDGESLQFTRHVFNVASGGMDLSKQKDVIKEYERLASALRKAFPEVRIYRSGILFFSSEAARRSKSDISLIGAGSAFGIIFLIGIIFRSAQPIALPTLSIALGVGFALFVSHAVFSSLHIITIIFGASLIGVVVDYSLHYFYFFRAGEQQSRVNLYRALMLSVCTSMLGYCALSFSGLYILTQISIFSALGLLFSWLMVVVLGPYILPQKITIHDSFLYFLVDRCLVLLVRIPSRFIVLFFIFVLSLSTIVTLYAIRFNDNPSTFFSPDTQLIEEERLISEAFSAASFEPASYVLVHGKNNQEVYEKIQLYTQYIKSRLDERPLFGIHSLLPSLDAQRSIYTLQGNLLNENGVTQNFLSSQGISSTILDEMTRSYSESKNKYLNPQAVIDIFSGSATSFWLQDKDSIYSFMMIPRGANLEVLRDAADIYEGVEFLGIIGETKQKLGELRKAALQFLGVALAVISIFLLVYSRTIQSIQLIAVPILSLLLTGLIYAVFSIPVTLFHVVAMFLVVGLGMDYIIFVSEMREDIRRVLSAIVVSAATSLLSFGLLSLSSMPVVAAFGLTVLLGNSFNVLFCLVYAGIILRKYKAVGAE